jgi:ribonuclease Z
MKKTLRYIISTILVLGVLAWTIITYFPEKLVPFMLSRQIKNANPSTDLLDDKEAITVFTVGTSSPLPSTRVQTGNAIFVNGHFFMFDVGDGTVQKMENMKLPLSKIDGIFITHFHSDHFIDMPYLINRSWVLGRTNDLHVYGPDGLDSILMAGNQFLKLENQYRVAHHGSTLMESAKSHGISHEFKNEQGKKQVIYQQDGITITAFDVNHEPIEPAVGYAIEYKGKKVVISGDTKKNDLVLEMSKDADLLIHEIILKSLLQQISIGLKESGNTRNAKLVSDIQNYHTSPAEVAELATKAQVKKLVLSHFAPAPDLKVVENLYRKELTGYVGALHFANDGDKFIVK